MKESEYVSKKEQENNLNFMENERESIKNIEENSESKSEIESRPRNYELRTVIDLSKPRKRVKT